MRRFWNNKSFRFATSSRRRPGSSHSFAGMTLLILFISACGSSPSPTKGGHSGGPRFVPPSKLARLDLPLKAYVTVSARPGEKTYLTLDEADNRFRGEV